MGARGVRARLAGVLVTVGATALGGVAAATPAVAEDSLTMVALGDSSAAGPLTGVPSSVDCARSTNNWPAMAAAELGATLTDVTCSGAVTADLTAKRFGYIAPQLDAVQPDTDIVVMAIGANDLSLGTTVPSCFQLLPPPLGVSCKARLTADGDRTDAQLAAVAPRVADAIQRIHATAPDAQVVLVGYLTYWQQGGCYPADPIWGVDADWLQSIFDRLDAMLARTAAANGAAYADIRTPSSAHGLCAAPAQRWVEGLAPLSPAAPYHPNAAGMAAAGRIVAAAVSR